jgi:hypothetical protein
LASEKQIAANRANAKKSTGPKTAAGRLKSSRNAFRHGLSLLSTEEPANQAEAKLIAQTLVSDQEDHAKVVAAAEIAQAHLDLRRIQAVRAELIAETDFTSASTEQLRRLAALDRYERLALTRRRQASRKL